MPTSNDLRTRLDALRTRLSQVKRSVYADQMAFVRIDVRVPDPSSLLEEIWERIGSSSSFSPGGIAACPRCAKHLVEEPAYDGRMPWSIHEPR